MAIERGAVGKGGGVLLISNSLFRSQDIQTRKKWVGVVDAVKEQGGEVRVLSSMHESGKRLEGLGGIAAILTYAIEDLDEEVIIFSSKEYKMRERKIGRYADILHREIVRHASAVLSDSRFPTAFFLA